MSGEEYAYGHVLEALTGGLYPDKLDILREYIQNSYDSIREYAKIAKKPSQCSIDVSVKAGSLLVHDNATGMNLDTIREYRKIGYSKKPYGEYAGWRGIGKAAGLAVCEKMIVTTSPFDTSEGYQLEFNSAEMLKIVREFRSKGENIPLNQLIEKYSQLETFNEEKGEHYTTVELCKISQDSPELLDPDLIKAHLSQISPVPFDPKFEYKNKIEENLAGHVEDYFPVTMNVNKQRVFKPYLESWQSESEKIKVREPEFLPVYDDKGELIAYAWFCMNAGKGQIAIDRVLTGRPIDVSGLVYRVRDIRIGDAQLTRKTLWRTTPERAFYAMGEIHVLDARLEPTADRNDFKDNFARYQLYQFCSKVIAAEINRKAGRQSSELRAVEKIDEAFVVVGGLNKKIQEPIPKELLPQMIYEAQLAKEEVHKRVPFAIKASTKKKAERTVSVADKVINRLTGLTRPETAVRTSSKIYDLSKELKFSKEVTLVYETIVRVLRDYFLNDPVIYEELIRRIQEELRRIDATQE